MSAAQPTSAISALGTENISSLLLRFSWPAIAGAVTTALYNFVDRIFVGHGVGADGIAAVSLSYPLMLIMMAFGMLIGFGGNTLASISLGRNRLAEAERVLGNVFTLYLLLTVLFSCFGYWFMTPLLLLFGASSQTLPLAESYFSILLIGVLGHEVSFGMNSFIRVAGKPRVAMVTLLIGAGLNLLLDGLFIFVLNWGIRGAALATILAQAVSAFWVMSFFFSARSSMRLRMANMGLRLSLVRRIVIAGSPMWLMAVSGCVIQALLNNRLQLLGGDRAVVIMGIVFSVYSLVRLPVSGLSQGAQPIISYNYGSADFQRIGATLMLAVLYASVLVSVGFFVIELYPLQLLRLFNLQEASSLHLGTVALRSFMLMLPLTGVQIVATNFFQAIGKPSTSLLLTLCHQFVLLVPLVLILPRYLGLNGVWLAAPVAEILSFIVTISCLKREIRTWRYLQPAMRAARSGLPKAAWQ